MVRGTVWEEEEGHVEQHVHHGPICACASLSPSSPASGENVATDGNVDLSKLEVSLTLTNKFEGLETDADDTKSQSLLLRWEHSLGPLGLPGPASWLLWSGHPAFLPDSLTLPKFSPKPNWPSPSCSLSCFPSGGLSFWLHVVAEGKGLVRTLAAWLFACCCAVYQMLAFFIVYLAVPDLSCTMRNLLCGMWDL